MAEFVLDGSKPKGYGKMATVWERVEQLSGRTLLTKTGKAFKVVSVDRQYVTVEPERTGTPRLIRRVEVESAHDLHLPLDELTATRLVQERVTVVNPVYIVAMLKAMEGASETKPNPTPPRTTRPEQNSVEVFISQLERIAKLHQDGVLSDKDFAQAKLKLLKITE